ncbi:glycosyltransferase family 2 protein [Caldisericum exile]|uniref:Glycosyltransferase n=1 Tax=Caldisericum exile (strain DSM 21853 / NBRC 104410 / AZM16c01) TaxID=511051 RepID=A0A7U6GF68_CALEA|nr:glycosyltransferase family 2 protein [Caldisericum exile]BAL81279.1 putative glycosyltransferase [Caldisericum exile AZM16c01]
MLIAIIPAKDEAHNIKDVIIKTKQYVDFVLVIDDGSVDDTKSVAESAGAFVIRNEVNLGKADALKIGFKYAIDNGFDTIALLDADGQHDPNELPKLMNKLSEGYDIVVGARKFSPLVMPPLRIFANSFSSFLVSLICHTKILDSQSGYRVLRTDVVKKITFETKRYQLDTEMLIKAAKCGFKIGFVEINTIYTERAKSKINQIIDPLKFLFVTLRLVFYRCKK